jgi:hypothetical protein
MKVELRDEVDLVRENLQGWLLKGKQYVVLSVEEYSRDLPGLRVESEDSGQPVVFKASLFALVDGSIPKCWRALAMSGGFVELGPEEFGEPGFWERCFDREPEALGAYARVKGMVEAEG